MRVSLDWLNDIMDVKSDIAKVQNALTMSGLEITSIVNIEDDKVMDIEVTPNRPDCLSILGIARELSAAIDRPIKLPDSVKKNMMKKGKGTGPTKIEILDKHACPRYVGCIMKNVKVGPSPKWLVKRLNAMGVRSINNIVDITNYVLFELGQPLHTFDLDKLNGKRIIVRRAKKGESIVTIDNVHRALDPNILVIADIKHPIAIAGIMGGKDTEISEATKNILLESAYFDPVIIRKAEYQLGLCSESSYRFERGVDFGMVLAGSIRAQELIKEVACGKLMGQVTDIGGKIEKEKEITLYLDEIKRVLGVEIDTDEIKGIFERLNFSPVKKKGKLITYIPSYRSDINSQIDLIEEVARFYGYENIPVKLPAFTVQKSYKLEKKSSSLENEARRLLSGLGMNEIVTYTLISRPTIESLGIPTENLVRLKNPLSSQQEFMRPSLLSEMLEVINWNLNRKNTFLKLFELNKVYLLDKETGEVQEKLRLSLGMCGATSGNWKEKSREMDFFDLKGVVEVLFESLGIKEYSIEALPSAIFKDTSSTSININKKSFGILGEMKQDVAKRFDIKRQVYLCEIFIEDLLEYVNLKKIFTPLPRFPSIKRDIAVLIGDAISASSIYKLIQEEAKGLVKSVDIFDLYKGQQIEEGKKSIAYTIEYRSDEKTLKDEEVNEVHKKVLGALVKKLGAQIR